ncbi:MAG TPA: peptide chain release factor N(5)-glutamine methyltransferase [Vicinamibacterales bacterium]
MTIQQRVAAARKRLRDAGIPPDEADLDGRLLAEHVLGWTPERLLIDERDAETPEFIARYDVLVERRARREPIAYIVGHQEFWGLEFEVAPAVLIPRPETELIVESALALIPHDQPCDVADICTGSGCVAVALAKERLLAHIVATELSNAALEIAQRNASRHGTADRISFARADLFGDNGRAFDVVVSNPPYVAEKDRPSIQPEVRDHEPALALFAGPDGLHVIRRLVQEAPARLRPGGSLIFEFGFGQADAVEQLISQTRGLKMIELRPDLQNIPRAALARRE